MRVHTAMVMVVMLRFSGCLRCMILCMRMFMFMFMSLLSLFLFAFQ